VDQKETLKLEFTGRFLGIPMLFNNNDDFGKEIKGKHKTFSSSIDYSDKLKEQEEFNKILSLLLIRCHQTTK
jgi:hypothetical protein